MVYNTISTKSIISKILRDLNIQEDPTRIADWIEWIGEGLIKIGAIKSMNTKITGKENIPLIRVSGYQAKLPEDLYKISGVNYSASPTGAFTALRYGTGTFDARGEATSTVPSPDDFVAADSDIVSLTMDLYNLSYEDAVVALNTDSLLKAKMNMLLIDKKQPTVQEQVNPTTDLTYVVNGSYIKLNIKEGYLMLAYTTIPMDEDGFPLIPDDAMFTEALYWYVVQKYWYPDWAAGNIRDRVYLDARSSWRFYRKAAYAAAMLPSVDQLESLKNQSLKLYPEINDHSNYFSTSGEQQIIYR